jgi:predicted nucleic acid-binding protein
MPAIGNSSPLILCSAIGRLGLLQDVYGEVRVPPAVWREVVASGISRIGSAEAEGAPWIRRQSPPEETFRSLPLAGLHPGESQAIALAFVFDRSVPIILDDLQARRIAEGIGLTVTGSAGVLLTAKRLGLIRSVKPLLEDLLAADLYLGNPAVRRILELAGEF